MASCTGAVIRSHASIVISQQALTRPRVYAHADELLAANAL
jgi:hypothetical protein